MLSNKPRESLLSLFDPLAHPRTPERDTSSPDSSDKENEGPGQLTVFFNRIYTKPPQNVVDTPIGKLIDVGDTTIRSMINTDPDNAMDSDDLDEQATEEQTNMNDIFSPTKLFPVAGRRQPLADIRLESVQTCESLAAVREETANRAMQHEAAYALAAVSSSDALTDAINSINLSSMSISDDVEPIQTDKDVEMFPEINVSPPEADIAPPTTTEAHSCSDPGSTSLNAMTTPHQTQRQSHLTTSSADPRRTSVDLQSSFRMHLGSPEMSFDLLNDKISFFGQDGSFWNVAEDDTLDFKKEEAKMIAIAEEYDQSLTQETIPSPNPIKHTPPKSAYSSPFGALRKSPFKPIAEPARRFVFKAPPKASLSGPPEVPVIDPLDEKGASSSLQADTSDAFRTPAVKSTPPISVDKENAAPRKQPSISTTFTPPMASVAPSIPALRFVKKPFKPHDRTTPIPSASTGTYPSKSPSASASSSRSVSRAGAASPDLVPASDVQNIQSALKTTTVVRKPVPRPMVKGLQRPPPGAILPPSSKFTITSLAKLRPVGTSASASTAKTKTMSGAREAKKVMPTLTVSKLSGIQRPTAASASRISESKSAAGVGTVSGIRPPSRLPAPRSGSNLAPPSRLPGASRVSVTTGLKGSSGSAMAGKPVGTTLRRVL